MIAPGLDHAHSKAGADASPTSGEDLFSFRSPVAQPSKNKKANIK